MEGNPLFFAVGRIPEITVELKNVVVEAGDDTPQYEGPYEVTPRVETAVTLKTKALRMREDVVIHKIPQFEVSNDAGGKTFIIGDEYYG